MIKRYLAAILGVSLCCGPTTSASAQQSDGPSTFYAYARNKIGLLRYCRNQAIIGQVAADRAVKAVEVGLRRLAVSGPAEGRGDKAEKAGEAGFWEDANGRQDLPSVASLFGTTTTGLCKEMAGQSSTVQQPPATKQVAAKVATAASNEPGSPPAASTEPVASAPAAGSASAIECEGNFQVQKNGNRIATPYCQDDYLAIVARKYGMRVSGKDIRQGYSEKQRACRLVGQDNRVRDACSQYYQFKRVRR